MNPGQQPIGTRGGAQTPDPLQSAIGAAFGGGAFAGAFGGGPISAGDKGESGDIAGSRFKFGGNAFNVTTGGTGTSTLLIIFALVIGAVYLLKG